MRMCMALARRPRWASVRKIAGLTHRFLLQVYLAGDGLEPSLDSIVYLLSLYCLEIGSENVALTKVVCNEPKDVLVELQHSRALARDAFVGKTLIAHECILIGELASFQHADYFLGASVYSTDVSKRLSCVDMYVCVIVCLCTM